VASAEKALSGDADAALSFGDGTDAPTTENDNGPFERADEPAEARKAFEKWCRKTDGWKSNGLKEMRQAQGRARSLVLSYEGRIGLFATTMACRGWKTLAKALGKSGPAPPGKAENRRRAKAILDG
jgi:hypothetical protein